MSNALDHPSWTCEAVHETRTSTASGAVTDADTVSVGRFDIEPLTWTVTHELVDDYRHAVVTVRGPVILTTGDIGQRNLTRSYVENDGERQGPDWPSWVVDVLAAHRPDWWPADTAAR